VAPFLGLPEVDHEHAVAGAGDDVREPAMLRREPHARGLDVLLHSAQQVVGITLKPHHRDDRHGVLLFRF
jgi:hypothetical protein